MSIFRRKKQTDAEAESLKSFLDMIAPSIVKFETGYYICGNTFRCVWALREYPTSTDDLAILRHLGEKHGVTLHIYTRMVSPLEERKIVHNAEIRNRMNRGSSQDLQRSVEAESNLQDVANLIGSLHRNKEPLLHCAVYIEMIAGDMQELQILQTNVEVELMRSKLNVDKLKLRQPFPRRRARVGDLCGFPDTAERVPARSPKTGRCADVRECPAELQHRSRSACGWLSAEKRAASGEAGQSRGVVRALRRSQLPAVRAVWSFRAGVVAKAKIAPLGSEAQIAPLFQGKQRGCTLKLEEKRHGKQQDQVPALADAGVQAGRGR